MNGPDIERLVAQLRDLAQYYAERMGTCHEGRAIVDSLTVSACDDLVRSLTSAADALAAKPGERAEPIVAYSTESCPKHHGMSWTTTAQAVTIAGWKCPLCEQDASAGRKG